MLNNSTRLINFKQKNDERGSLVVWEENLDIPFDIKRVLTIYNVGGTEVRGKHSNRNTEFVLICVSGNAKV